MGMTSSDGVEDAVWHSATARLEWDTSYGRALCWVMFMFLWFMVLGVDEKTDMEVYEY